MTSKPKIDTAWFRDRIIVRHLSQRKLAKALGLDPAAMSLMLRGKRHILPTEAEKLAIELGVPLDEVLEHIGINTDAGAENTAPIVGISNDAGEVRLGRVEGPRRVPSPVGMPSGGSVLRVQGEGFVDGWLAFYVPSSTIDPAAIGRLAVVQIAGANEWYLRVLRRGYTKGTYNLQDVLGKGIAVEGVKVASAAPVLWLKTN